MKLIVNFLELHLNESPIREIRLENFLNSHPDFLENANRWEKEAKIFYKQLTKEKRKTPKIETLTEKNKEMLDNIKKSMSKK